ATLDKGVWRGETALLHRDGHEIPVSQVIMAHCGTDGILCYLSTVMRDITDIRQATDALRESEARYQNVVEHANEIILVIQDGRLKYCNPKTFKETGYTWDDLSSRPFLDFVHPDDHHDIMDRYVRRMSGERMDDSFRFRLVSKKRGIRWVEVRAVLIDWEGQPAILDLMTDITDRRNAEVALRQSEERYRAIFENTGNATVLFDEQGTIVLANSNFEKLSGYSRQEIEGSMKWMDFVVADDVGRMIHYHRQSVDDPKSAPTRYEFRFLDRSGTVKEVLLTVARIKESNQWVSSLMDITERKQAEEALDHSRTQLQAVIDASLDAITVTDADGMFLASNRALQERWGKSREDIVGHSAAEVLTPEIFASRMERIRRCIASGLSDHFLD
ncbi:PAS domain S-box protein, partial [bacterium]|nr:PAS domain S-box protein [bacterium]